MRAKNSSLLYVLLRPPSLRSPAAQVDTGSSDRTHANENLRTQRYMRRATSSSESGTAWVAAAAAALGSSDAGKAWPSR